MTNRTMEMERLKNEMRNVDLSGFKVKRTEMHPNSEELLKLCKTIVAEDFNSIDIDIAASILYTFPLMKNPAVASCCIVFVVVSNFLDDYLDKFPEDYGKWVQYFRTKQFPENGKVSKWYRHFMDFAKAAIGEAALNELLENYSHCISKVPERISITTGQSNPTVKEFLDVRLVDVGVSELLYFHQIDSGVEMTDDLRDDPDWIGLQKETIMNVTIVNDAFSLRKEITANDYKFNYVYVKMANENISAQRAIDEIALESENAFRMAQTHGKNLKERNDPNLSLYVDAIYAAMLGSIYWSTICKRYNQ